MIFFTPKFSKNKKAVFSLLLCFIAGTLVSYSQTFNWAIGMSAMNSDPLFTGMALDGSGNIYVCGQNNLTSSSIDLDPSAGTATVSPSTFFFAKYSSTGTFVWVKTFSFSGGFSYIRSIAVDATSNIYICGQYGLTMDFDPGAGIANLTLGTGGECGFVAKYSSTGTYTWAKSIKPNTWDADCYELKVDGSGNAYVTGLIMGGGSTDFSGGPSITPSNTGLFLAKYSSTGTCTWAFDIVANAGSATYARLDLDGSNVLLTGRFQGTADFDPIGTTNMTSSSGYAVFVAKYDANKNLLSNFRFGECTSMITQEIDVDGSGNITVIGTFSGTPDFDPGAGTAYRTNIGATDGFAAKYNSSGTHLWNFQIEDGSVSNIKYDSGNNLVISGTIASSADFDPSAGTMIKTVVSGSDAYIAKYDANGNLFWVNMLESTASNSISDHALNSTNDIFLAGTLTGGTVDFDPGSTVNSKTHTYDGLFIAKYNGCNYTINTSQNNILCNGNSTGSATITNGGVGSPYNYLWSSGETINTISGKVAGTYTCTITDNTSCAATQSIILTQPALLDASASVKKQCDGFVDGAINLTPAGGVSPYTFLWSSSETTEDISGKPAASYFVTITDANSCASIKNYAIQANPPLSISGSASQTCPAANTGAISTTPSGGTAPYTYTWSSGQTTQNLSNLAAGTYFVTLTDNSSCTATNNFIITTSPSIILSGTITNNVCNGGSTGAVDATVSGGIPGYTYNWTPSGEITEDISIKVAGTYTLTVTDANGCQANSSFLITEPAAVTASSTFINPSCNGQCNGSIDATPSGGSGVYTIYSWSNGSTTQDITNLCTGTYTLTITDGNGCTGTHNRAITQPAILAVSSSYNSANCNCTGSINATVSGGTPAYTYNWSGGQTTEDISSLCASTYSLTVTDANSCTATHNRTVSDLPAVPAANAASTVTSVSFTANWSASGGATGYLLDVSLNNGFTSIIYEFNNLDVGNVTSYSVTGLSPSTPYYYRVRAYNACGINGTSSNTITVNTTAASVNTYCISSYNGTYTAISGGSQIFTGTTDDNIATGQAIGFTFNFRGTNYTMLNISSNGFITFGSAPSGTNYTPISTNNAGYSLISAFGRDLIGTTGGIVRMLTLGNSPNRTLVIQWEAWARFISSAQADNLNFQIILYETSNMVEIAYGNCSATSTTGQVQVGLRGASNSDFSNRKGTSWTSTVAGSVNTDNINTNITTLPSNGLVFRYSPLVGLSGAISGNNTVCISETGGSYSVTSILHATSYNWILTGGATIASGNGSNSITVDFSGDAVSGNIIVNGSNVCGTGNSASLAVTVTQVPTIAVAGTDQNLCNVTSSTLAGNSPATGTGLWSLISGSATIVSPSSPASDISGLIPGSSATLRWTISNSPCTPSSDDISISVFTGPAIFTSAITPTLYCAGGSISVPYDIACSFNAGNTFTAQLSDASGSFATPVTIGSVTSQTPGTITAEIPSSTPDGTGYRIRVVSSDPSVTGTDNGSDITINVCTRYWVNGAGNWNDPSNWSATTGGASGASMPHKGVHVYLDGNSFTGPGQIITLPAGIWKMKSINMSGNGQSAVLVGQGSLVVGQ